MEFTLVTELVVVLPIAVQEMVLALWLIVKGWNPNALDPPAAESGSGHTDAAGSMRPTMT